MGKGAQWFTAIRTSATLSLSQHQGKAAMAKFISEYEILREIYLRYRGAFKEQVRAAPGSNIHLPIDLRLIAERLGHDKDELESRIFNSINNKYSYQNVVDNSVTYLFPPSPTKECRVNFPVLTGVIADQMEARRDALISKWWPLGVSIFSTLLAAIALAK